MGAEVQEIMLKQPATSIDFEDKVLSDRRLRKTVKKLSYLNTSRLLDIMGYRSTENDSKRLEYAVVSFGSN